MSLMDDEKFVAKGIDKTLIIKEIDKIIYCIKEERKANKILNSLGIEVYWEGDRFLGYARDSYLELIWKLIQEHRGVLELIPDEYEFFSDLIFNAAYEISTDGKVWTSEEIFDYFMNVDLIITDFDLFYPFEIPDWA